MNEKTATFKLWGWEGRFTLKMVTFFKEWAKIEPSSWVCRRNRTTNTSEVNFLSCTIMYVVDLNLWTLLLDIFTI